MHSTCSELGSPVGEQAMQEHRAVWLNVLHMEDIWMCDRAKVYREMTEEVCFYPSKNHPRVIKELK